MLNFLLSILAVVRLTEIVVFEKIFRPVRELAGISHDDEGRIIGYDDGFFAELFVCHRCVSVWAAGFVSFIVLFMPRLGKFVVWSLGLSWLGYRLYDKT